MCYNPIVMKRFILYILSFFLILTNTSANAAVKYTQKQLSVVAVDGFNLKASLEYPKIKSKKDFKTVVLLHSLGTDSTWWSDLPDKLKENGYAVLKIDLRGNGQSVYNKKLQRVSWTSLTNKSYAKYPDDVISVIKYIQTEYPKYTFFNKWAIVGSDFGASAGVKAADKLSTKPATIVMLSPVVESKGLYIPVSIAQLDSTDFLAIASEDDQSAIEAEKYLKRFAQKEFAIYNSSVKSTGMVMLKNDTELTSVITEWIKQYLAD